MGLLTKCGITNAIIPEYDNNEVFMFVIAKNPENQHNDTSTITCIETGEGLEVPKLYHSQYMCTREYSPIGVYFKGIIKGYSGLIADMTDEFNIKNLKKLVECTQYHTDEYDIIEINRLMEQNKYQDAWSLISKPLQSMYNNYVYTTPIFGYDKTPNLATTMVIHKELHDVFMSDDFKRKVDDIFNYRLRDVSNSDRLLMIDSAATEFFNYEHKMFGLSAWIESQHNAYNIFGRVLCELKPWLNRKRCNYQTMTLDEIKQVFHDMIELGYYINCVEYMQTEFKRDQTCSIEDYNNTYSQEAVEIIYDINKRITNSQQDEYTQFIDNVQPIKQVTRYATYIQDGDTEKLERIAGRKIDINIEDQESEMLIAYDVLSDSFYVIEDSELMADDDIFM